MVFDLFDPVVGKGCFTLVQMMEAGKTTVIPRTKVCG
jgi:hypothetical protein